MPPPAPSATPAAIEPPYLGLAAYGEGDAGRFYGRSRAIEMVIANVLAGRVTVLYGPSGVGKSSLLHAGVAHRLQTMRRPSPVVVIDDWEQERTGQLAAAIQAAATSDAAGDAASDGPAPALGDALQSLRDSRRPPLLVILDRFEDYLRRLSAGATAPFAEALAASVSTREVLVRVLIAVREDHLADLDRLGGVIPDLFANVLRLDPLSRVEAREAITGPVTGYNERLRRAGRPERVTLEPGDDATPGLAETVLGQLQELSAATAGRGPSGAGDSSPDPAGEAAAIEPAFLSLTMRRLWDADIGEAGTGTLRVATLDRLGGAAQIFETHLDATMAALPVAEQSLAADLLRLMVTRSGAVQRYSAADLADVAQRDPVAVEALLEKLSHEPARLLRPIVISDGSGGASRTEYELAHQVLARPALEWRSRFTDARLERRTRRLLSTVVTVTAIAIALAGYVALSGPLSRLELDTVAARFSVRGAQPPDRDIVLVTLDDAEHSQVYGSGPVGSDRPVFARALRAIASAGPRAIACDIFFPVGYGSRRQNGQLTAAVMSVAAPLVLATNDIDSRGQTQLIGAGVKKLSNTPYPAAGWAGFPIGAAGAGAIYSTMERSFALQSTPGQTAVPLDTLAVATAHAAGLAASTIARLPATAWIDFRGGAGTFPSVALGEVLAGDPAALERLHDRIVVLGDISRRGSDSAHQTIAPGDSVMSGTQIQADAISTALRGFPLRDAGSGIDVALIVLLGLVPLAAVLAPGSGAPIAGAARCALAVAGAAVLFGVGAQLAFDAGKVIDVVFPLASLVLAGAGVLVLALLRRDAHGTRDLV
ncbi:MAG: CHASE2 domain-containing protein [Solirubrobacteraceae bacterium]|jgi:CHASE2 domain-containing sensor protein